MIRGTSARALSREELDTFHDDGLLLLPELFTADEVAVLNRELPAMYAVDSPRRVIEKDGVSVRSLFAPHTTSEVYRRLARDPRILCKAQQVLGGDVYLYQYKVNAKVAFTGDVWAWHQDYIYWLKEDGLPTSNAVNVVVFLDEVTEFNGPLFLIPGSHRAPVIDVPPGGLSTANERRGPYRDGPAWLANLVADIKYSLDRPTITKLIADHGMRAPKGPAGSVLMFHSNTVHASPQNISPSDRAICIISYSRVDNVPVPVGEPRPDFITCRDYTPLQPIDDGKSLAGT